MKLKSNPDGSLDDSFTFLGATFVNKVACCLVLLFACICFCCCCFFSSFFFLFLFCVRRLLDHLHILSASAPHHLYFCVLQCLLSSVVDRLTRNASEKRTNADLLCRLPLSQVIFAIFSQAVTVAQPISVGQFMVSIRRAICFTVLYHVLLRSHGDIECVRCIVRATWDGRTWRKTKQRKWKWVIKLVRMSWECLKLDV